MPVVPISKGKSRAAASGPPPDPTFTMMAAAQMHSEGRLVTPTSNAKLDSIRLNSELNPTNG